MGCEVHRYLYSVIKSNIFIPNSIILIYNVFINSNCYFPELLYNKISKLSVGNLKINMELSETNYKLIHQSLYKLLYNKYIHKINIILII
jgi:hypothetical protein